MVAVTKLINVMLIFLTLFLGALSIFRKPFSILFKFLLLLTTVHNVLFISFFGQLSNLIIPFYFIFSLQRSIMNAEQVLIVENIFVSCLLDQRVIMWKFSVITMIPLVVVLE